METDLAALSRELLNERMDERRDISRLIHDSISQHLVALSFSANALPTVTHNLPDLIERCCRDIRVISCMLTPPPRGQANLVATIEAYAGWMREETGLTIKVDPGPQAGKIGTDAESLVLAAVQEWMLRTLLKRVKASLFIRVSNDDAMIVLELKSVPDPALTGVNGMQAMGGGWAVIRERVRALGGRLEITADSAGARARMSLPQTGRA